ncbi:MAG: hypothetical protein LBB95_01230 [Mycoplasmataceae bacterium]|nr:hypothetical protein [Mycoplasmataceae bacterium]
MKKTAGFYLYLSLDIENSTLYKTYDRDWAELFTNIYKDVFHIATNTWKDCKLWKSLGDELLFYKKVDSKKDLLQSFASINQICVKSNTYIKKMSPNNIKVKLAFKTTLFSGVAVNDLGKDKNKWSYLTLITPNLADEDRLDFLGPDIDTGFRIAKFSLRNIIVLDAKLSYILSLINPKFITNAKIIQFEILKGIWKNHHYPIIWYVNDWKKLASSFSYEDKFKNKALKYLEINNDTKFSKISELKRIFNELGKNEEINAIKRILKI